MMLLTADNDNTNNLLLKKSLTLIEALVLEFVPLSMQHCIPLNQPKSSASDGKVSKSCEMMP